MQTTMEIHILYRIPNFFNIVINEDRRKYMLHLWETEIKSFDFEAKYLQVYEVATDIEDRHSVSSLISSQLEIWLSYWLPRWTHS